jgi:glycosyltransferase involved in cell wall biosynthesis
MTTFETAAAAPQVSVIVPARNEEANLATCLSSLVSQTGVPFEIIVVDDHSSDRTREIAVSFATANPDNIRVIEADPLPDGWIGKNNAVMTGARSARGKWLLFTDADTLHIPGSLARALAEAQENGVDLLSYSPQQIAVTFWEMAVMPVVFAELERQYPPKKVSDPASPIAAANGQYVLIRREAYEAVGGYAAIAGEILEDVALACAAKTSGRRILFRNGDAVRTRMYRNFLELREGWTKNLALLFPKPGWLAVKTLLLWAIPWTALAMESSGARTRALWGMLFVGGIVYVTARLRRANFDLIPKVLGAIFGMPAFAYLLLRSKRALAQGKIAWKGRTYGSAGGFVKPIPDRAPSATPGRAA